LGGEMMTTTFDNFLLNDSTIHRKLFSKGFQSTNNQMLEVLKYVVDEEMEYSAQNCNITTKYFQKLNVPVWCGQSP